MATLIAGAYGTGSISSRLVGSVLADADAGGKFIEDYGAAPHAYAAATGEILFAINMALPVYATASGSLSSRTRKRLIATATASGSLTQELIDLLTAYGCFVMNIDTKRTYRHDNCDFMGMGRFNGKVLVCDGSDIHDAETVTLTDNGTAIAAYMEIDTDFGMPNHVPIRDILTDESDLTVIFTSKEGNVFTVNASAGVTQGVGNSVNRQAISKEWNIRIQNRTGQAATVRRFQGNIFPVQIKGA